MKSVHSVKLDSIQGLRAIAVLLVIAYHYGFPVKNGFIGVDVFFVISGFVITQSLIRNSTNSKLNELINFYIKRIARLFPAFFVVFLFTMLAVFLVYSPNVGVQQNAIKGSLGAMLAISNFAIPRISGGYFGADGDSNPFLHTWSLSVEEQFYVIYPLLLFFLVWITDKKHAKRKQNGVLLALIVFSFLLTIDTAPFSKLSSLGTLTYFAPQARAWEFLLGAAVAFNSFSTHIIIDKRAKLIKFTSIFIIFIFATAFRFNPDNSLYWILIPVGFSALFLAFPGERPTSKFQVKSQTNLSSRLSVHLGNLSYSLYLWHWPIYVTGLIMYPEYKYLVVPISLLLTYLMSLFTYFYVESKFNSVNFSSKKFWLSTLAIGQVIFLSIFFIMFAGVTRGWDKDWALNSHAVMNRGCDSGIIDFEKCNWGKKESKNSIFLVGDSMAWAIADSFIQPQITESLGLQSFVRNACSISDVPIIQGDICNTWRAEVVAIILDKQPRLVVIANSPGYPEIVLEGMGQLVKNLNKANIKVLFILPPPGGDEFSGRHALAFRPGAADRIGVRPESANLDKYNLGNYQKSKLFAIYDPADVLCNQTCIIAKDGNDYYTYGGHLSFYANKVLVPSINKAVLELLSN